MLGLRPSTCIFQAYIFEMFKRQLLVLVDVSNVVFGDKLVSLPYQLR